MRKLPKETEKVEFKHNSDEHLEIGEYQSALANSSFMVGHCSEGRPMIKISFDGHLIEEDSFGREHAPKWFLSACYGHGHFI